MNVFPTTADTADTAGDPLRERKLHAMTMLMEAELHSNADDFKAALAAYREGMSERGLPVQTLMNEYLSRFYTHTLYNFDIEEMDAFCDFVNSRADDIIRFCGPYSISQVCGRIIDFKLQTKTDEFYHRLRDHCERGYEAYRDNGWKPAPDSRDNKGFVMEHIKLMHLAIVRGRTKGHAAEPYADDLQRLKQYVALYDDYHAWKDATEEQTGERADDSLYDGIGKWCEKASDILKSLREEYDDRMFTVFLNMCEHQIEKASGAMESSQLKRALCSLRMLIDVCDAGAGVTLGVDRTDRNSMARDIITCLFRRLKLLKDPEGKESRKAAELADSMIREAEGIDYGTNVAKSVTHIKDISYYLFEAAGIRVPDDTRRRLYDACRRVIMQREPEKYKRFSIGDLSFSALTRAKLLYRLAVCTREVGDPTEYKKYIDMAVETIESDSDIRNRGKDEVKREKELYRSLQISASESDREVLEMIGEIKRDPSRAPGFHPALMEMKRRDGRGFVMSQDTMRGVAGVYLEHFDSRRFEALVDGMDTNVLTSLDNIVRQTRIDLGTIRDVPYSRYILLSSHTYIANNRATLLKCLRRFDIQENRETFIGTLRAGCNFGIPDRMMQLLDRLIADHAKTRIFEMSNRKTGELLAILLKAYRDPNANTRELAARHIATVRDRCVANSDPYFGKADMDIADIYMETGEPLKALEAVDRAIDARPYTRYVMKRGEILAAIDDPKVTEKYNRERFMGNIYDDEEDDEVYDEPSVESFFRSFSLLDWQKYGDDRRLLDRIEKKGSDRLKQAFADARLAAERRNDTRRRKIIETGIRRKDRTVVPNVKGMFTQCIAELDAGLIGRRITDEFQGPALYNLCKQMIDLFDSTDYDENRVRDFTDIVIRALERHLHRVGLPDHIACKVHYVLVYCYRHMGRQNSAALHLNEAVTLGDRTGGLSDAARENLRDIRKEIIADSRRGKSVRTLSDHKNNPLSYGEVFARFNSGTVLKYIYHDWVMEGGLISGLGKDRKAFFAEADREAGELAIDTSLRVGFIDMLCDYIGGTDGWTDWQGCHHPRTLADYRHDPHFVMRQDNSGLSPRSLRDSVRFTSGANLREFFKYVADRHAPRMTLDIDVPDTLDFYCDKRTLAEAVGSIFKDLTQRYGDGVGVVIGYSHSHTPDGNTADTITITQPDARTPQTCKAFTGKLSGGGGNFAVIRETLRNVCDWAVETRWADGPRRVNCLSAYENLTVAASADIPSDGKTAAPFRHIFRFYNH